MKDVKAVVLAQEYIKSHHADLEFSVESVCSAVGYSRRQLDRLFQKHMGITLYEYIRAIYKDAPFVIMDEPTAALDPEAEAEVFEGFDRMVGNKTAIYISHRLASCKFCEDILVFDHGRVVQHGNHNELEKEEGMYKELWNAQARYYA